MYRVVLRHRTFEHIEFFSTPVGTLELAEKLVDEVDAGISWKTNVLVNRIEKEVRYPCADSEPVWVMV